MVEPRRALFLLSVLLVIALIAIPMAASQSFQSLSEVIIRNDDYEYEYQAGVLRQQDLWVVVGLRARGQLSGPQQLQLWKLDMQGKKLAEANLNTVAPAGRPQERTIRIYAIAALKNGNICLLTETAGSRIGFLVFDGGARLLTSRLVESNLPIAFISKVFATDDGDLIALGRSTTKGLLMKLRPSGEIAARTIIIRDDLTVLTDGFELADHTFALLGEHLNQAGQTRIWIGRVTINGEVLNKNTFAGQDGTIVYDADARTYMVIYASPGTKAWNVSLRTFMDDLSPAGQFNLLSAANMISRFRAIPAGDGNILALVASGKNQLWMGRVSKSGEVISSTTFEGRTAPWQQLWNYDLLSTPTDLFIPTTEMTVGNESELRQILRILRVRRS